MNPSLLKVSLQTKIVLHIDETGTADPLPFGMRGPPFVVVRVHPMAGELSRYTVTSNDPNDEPEEDIVQTARVPGRIIQTSKPSATYRIFHVSDMSQSISTGCSSFGPEMFPLLLHLLRLCVHEQRSSGSMRFRGTCSGLYQDRAKVISLEAR